MAIDFNQISGLSWKDWVKIPNNKILFESNPQEARRRYMEEEAEFIENVLLQERMQQERQAEMMVERQRQIMIASEKQQSLSRMLREVTQNQSDVDNLNPAPGTGASGAGGFNLFTGIGNYAIGTYLQQGGNQTANKYEADEGFDRFTVQ